MPSTFSNQHSATELKMISPLHSSTLLVFVIGLSFFFLFSTPIPFLKINTSKYPLSKLGIIEGDVDVYRFPKGQLSSILHQQYLSHHALHSSRLPLEIAALSARTNASKQTSVVVIGVEFGADVRGFAEDGYNVIAFEPMPIFYDRMKADVAENKHWNVTLHNVAAGNSSGVMNVRYRKNSVDIKVMPLDGILHFKENEQVSAMSIDVQGFEKQVLLGSAQTLKHVKVLWFEASACNNDLPEIMDLLDDDFAMFDFVPVGRLLNATERGYRKPENFLLNGLRPSTFGQYLNWLCSFKGDYFMVQTDILAIRRDIVLSLAPMIANISEWACGERNGNPKPCLLREMKSPKFKNTHT